MSGFEVFGEEKRVGEYELGNLYSSTSIWLEANTKLFVEDKDVISDTHEDLPVAQHSPRYNFEIPCKIICKIIPTATEFFDENDILNIAYSIPHFTIMGCEEEPHYQYQKPQCVFSIEKENDPKYQVDLTIEDDDNEDTWLLRRVVHANNNYLEKIIENITTLPFIDLDRFDDENSTKSYLAKQECELLSKIVGKLDEIKTMLPEPPLYISSE